MSSQLRTSRTFLAIAVGVGLLSGTTLAQDKVPARTQRPQQIVPTGAEDAAAPAAAARSISSAAVTQQQQAEQRLVEMTSESTEGLKVQQRADGTRLVDLEGQFMSVAIATPAKNGGYALSCQTGESAVEHAKHAHDVELGKAPKVLIRPTKQQPALEEK